VARPDDAAPTRLATVACALLLALYAVVVVRTAWVADDAFITLRTIGNALSGHGLGWNAGERVQAFTHPLWLALLTIVSAIGVAPYATALAAGIAVSLTTVSLAAWRLHASPVRASVLVSLFVLSKAFVDFSTSGLENPLTHALLLAFAALSLDENRWSAQRLAQGCALASGIALTRPDAVLLVAPALVWRIATRRRAADLGPVLAGLAPWLAWEAFSLAYYGTPGPNTALAKLGAGIPEGELVAQGLRYLGDSLRRDPITLAVVAGALTAAVLRPLPGARALAAGIALHLAAVVAMGGDFMSGRFLTPAFVVAALVLAESLPERPRRLRGLVAASIAALGLPFAPSSILSGRDYGDRASTAVAPSGIADERGFYFSYSGWWSDAPESRRPTIASSFVRAGLDLAAARAPIATLPAIGFAGFYAGSGVHVVDTLALADPFLSRLPMVRRAPPPFAARGKNWRIGHFERTIPSGYLSTLATGTNRLEDPALRRLWDDVALATRAPLLARGRASAIARLLFAAPATRERPEYRPPPWDELLAVQPSNLEALYQRGAARLSGGDPSGARTDLEAVVAASPGHGAASLELARLDLRERRIDDAQARIDALLALRPDDPDAIFLRGDVLRLRRRFDDAEAAYLDAARRAPNLRPAAWTNVGMLRAMRGDLEGARRRIDDALELSPGYEPAKRALAAITSSGRGAP
jgi:arabinofuranosyltransferase